MSKSAASSLSGSSSSNRSKRHDSTAGSGSSLATSALDRLRYNLSPVTSYYKPLIKSFGRKDASPSKKVSSLL